MKNIASNVGKSFNQTFRQVRTQLTPPNAYSWQTLIWLSVFSVAMAWIATDWARGFISIFGWLFLITGFSWAAKENSIPLWPWITGALICFWIFGSANVEERESLPSLAIVCWPLISALVIIFGKSINTDLRPKTPSKAERQNLIILVGTQLLLSCWLQFYFLTQEWVNEYPSLIADDFTNSDFVVKLDVPGRSYPRAVEILNLIGQKIETQLDGTPWTQVEQWLLEEGRQERLLVLKEEVFTEEEIAEVPEDQFWQFNSVASTEGAGYDLKLEANWEGPGSQREFYNSEKSCLITPTFSTQRALSVGRVECDEAATEKEKQPEI
ncbi:MAG: DUF5357 family protein [Spirulinaceae cyanobacterium]